MPAPIPSDRTPKYTCSEAGCDRKGALELILKCEETHRVVKAHREKLLAEIRLNSRVLGWRINNTSLEAVSIEKNLKHPYYEYVIKTGHGKNKEEFNIRNLGLHFFNNFELASDDEAKKKVQRQMVEDKILRLELDAARLEDRLEKNKKEQEILHKEISFLD